MLKPSPSNGGGSPPRHRGGLLSPITVNLPLPRHQTYIETRGSAGAWLFRKTRSRVEVLNDIDGEAINLSRVMVESGTRTRVLERYASAVDAHRIIPFGGDARISRAVQFVLSIEKASAVQPPSRKKLRFPLPLEPELQLVDRAMDRLRGVQIEDRSVADIQRRYDWRGALFFCDEREANWEGDDGQEVAHSLNSLKGKVMLLTSVEPPWAKGNERWTKVKTDATAGELWLNY
jgi:DNA adenine methylase